MWAISRHSMSVLHTPKMVNSVMDTIQKAVQDENKLVARSAVLALSALCEEAREVKTFLKRANIKGCCSSCEWCVGSFE
jgi:hypothetical protein